MEKLPHEAGGVSLWRLNAKPAIFFVETVKGLEVLEEDYKETLGTAYGNGNLLPLVAITNKSELSLNYLSETAKNLPSPRTFTKLLTLTPWVAYSSQSVEFLIPDSTVPAKISGSSPSFGVVGELFLTFKRDLFGGTEDDLLVGALLSGDYLKRPSCRFWGGKGLEGVRPVLARERKKFKQTVKLERKQMSYKRSLNLHTGGWFEIVRDVLKNDINPADREFYKDKLARNEYRKMKKELVRRPREGGKTLESVSHWVASYLEEDFLKHGKREEALSFILRGAQDFLQWEGGLHSQYVSVLRALGTLDQKKT